MLRIAAMAPVKHAENLFALGRGHSYPIVFDADLMVFFEKQFGRRVFDRLLFHSFGLYINYRRGFRKF